MVISECDYRWLNDVVWILPPGTQSQSFFFATNYISNYLLYIHYDVYFFFQFRYRNTENRYEFEIMSI